MIPTIFTLLLPAFVFGGIIIDIDVKTPNPKVEVYGEIIHEVSQQERTTFAIEDEQLKRAIAIYINDTEPNSIFIDKSEMTNALYGKINKSVGVKITVKPKLVNIERNCGLSGNDGFIKNDITINTDWKITGNISTEEITYNVYAKKNMTIKSTWGENIAKHDVFDSIFPSEEEARRGDIPFVLAVKCYIVLRLEYEATLSGDVVAVLSSGKKIDMQTYNVSDILAAAGLPTSVINTEIISMSYYYKNEEGDLISNYEYLNYDYYEDNGETDTI